MKATLRSGDNSVSYVFGLALLLLAGVPATIVADDKNDGFGEQLFGASAPQQAKPAHQEAKPVPSVIRFFDAEGGQQAKPADPVEAFLARKVEIDVSGMKLGDFSAAMSKLAGINIVLDKLALDPINVNSDSLVTLRVQGMTAGAAIKHVLRGIDPTLVCTPGESVLTLTTKETDQDREVRRVYDVRDLALPPLKPLDIQHVGGNAEESQGSLEDLKELLQKVVAPASWDAEGGNGSISSVGDQALVVVQTHALQQQVAGLIDALRAVRDGQKNPGAQPSLHYALATAAQRDLEEKVRRAMAQPAQLNFEKSNLETVLKSLSQTSSLPFMLDKSALEAINITGEVPVSIHIDKVSLRSALTLLLRQIDLTLTWSCQDECVLITTREEAGNLPRIVVYSIADMTRPAMATGLPGINAEELQETVVKSVESSSWDEEGGPGACERYEHCDVLVVLQRDDLQFQVASLLEEVRAVRRRHTAERQAALAPANPAGSKVAAPAAGTAYVVYHTTVSAYPAVPVVGEVDPSTGERPAGAAQPAQPKEPPTEMAELKKLVMEHVGADKWPAESTSMYCVGNRMIIRQTFDVHERIRNFLDGLQLLEPTVITGSGFQGGSISGAVGPGFQGGFGR